MEQNKRYSIFHSTIFRIIVVIIILVLPINIMTIIFSMITLRQSQAEVSREIQNTLNMAGDTLASTLETSVRQLSYLSVSSTDFSVVASKSQMEDKPERFYTSYANVGTALDNVLSGFDQLDVVYFVFPETDYLVSRGYPGLVYREYRNVLESMPDQEDEENAWRYMEIGGSAVLVSHDSWHDMDFGVVLNLERTLNKLNLPELEEGNLFLFTNREETLFTEEGESFFYQAGMDLEAVKNSSRYHVYRCPLENFDLTLIQIVDDQYSTFTIPTILRVMQYLSIILAVAVIPLLLYYISRMVNRPLNRLIKAINLIERGDLDYRIPEKSNGTEFEQINRSFNGMMEQIKNLKIDVYEQELEKKNIKMQYLSQQIQPHFILNALNLLYSYEPEEYPLIQKMILCISKYFRYIVKMNEEFVELSQEMNHIKNYFEIQRARFKRGEIRKQAKSLKSSRLWTAGKQVTTE
ncbi:MAG TPA: histidine kinase [Candidatus Scybalocola faecigallinarum]|uniref:Histidine kinase n=1 Tax=Candidatus Scybalocola faecigallinarum TaxID=2840941 RepID=A0A9D1JS51_9FIRM|nr:histidine kinase [Candidatus Scybalocola faecigallinarum]